MPSEPQSATAFDSTKRSLSEILHSINSGDIQLPDFQRNWIWDDEHVKSLLVSVSQSYPIGAIMLMQTGNPSVQFKPRTVEGVQSTNGTEPEHLILDGQQRLTSLYLSLLSRKPVPTRDVRGKDIKRWYYLDIEKAIDPAYDREEAIISVPEDRIVRSFRNEVVADYSTIASQCKAEMLPLDIALDTSAIFEWQQVYLGNEPSLIQARLRRWTKLFGVIQCFQNYQVPVISLFNTTPKEAVCQVFEKVNTGGVSLNAFELLTATFAMDDFNLRNSWSEIVHRWRQSPVAKLLRDVQNTDFLQTVTLLSSYERRRAAIASGIAAEQASGVTCKRKDMLRLTLEDYLEWAERTAKGYEQAARLLHSLRIFDARDIPYKSQIIPLSAILTILGDKAQHEGVRSKVARWLWCGIFGELYGGTTETRFARDLPEVTEWIEGGLEPTTIQEATFTASRLYSLRTRNSAAYKGVYALQISAGALDFRTGDAINEQVYFGDSIDVHHVFPQHWCSRNGIPLRRADCIVNKAPLSYKTNRIVGGNAPSAYLVKVQNQSGVSEGRMDEILSTHLVDPAAIRNDDFESFFRLREQELINRIEGSMGKKVITESLIVELPDDDDPDEDSSL